MSGNSGDRRKARRALERAKAKWREAYAEEVVKIVAWIERVEVLEFAPVGFEDDDTTLVMKNVRKCDSLFFSEKIAAFGLPPRAPQELRRFLAQKGVSFPDTRGTATALIVIPK